jgi:hypothetical protein
MRMSYSTGNRGPAGPRVGHPIGTRTWDERWKMEEGRSRGRHPRRSRASGASSSAGASSGVGGRDDIIAREDDDEYDEDGRLRPLLLPSFSGPDDEVDESDDGRRRFRDVSSARDNDDRAARLVADERRSRTEVMAVERSVGLLSIREYKDLLAERTSELEGLRNRYETEVESTGRDLREKDERLASYRDVMEEAELAIKAFGESVRTLEIASMEKDELIAELEERVRDLEAELERTLIVKAEMETQHRTVVEALNEGIARMEKDAGESDDNRTELSAEVTRLKTELVRVTEESNSSRTELVNAKNAIILRDERIKSSESEVVLMKEMLQSHIELYKNEISLSLESTTAMMNSLTQEKDSVIESLNAKIALLEQTLVELEEEKKAGALAEETTRKELNEMIQTLAIALTEKDTQIDVLQKNGRKLKKRHSAVGERKTRHLHYEIMSPEGYQKPQMRRVHRRHPSRGAYHHDETRDDEYSVAHQRHPAYYTDDSIFDY